MARRRTNSRQVLWLLPILALIALLLAVGPWKPGAAEETAAPPETTVPPEPTYLDAWFPPKDFTFMMEGEEEVVSQIAGGREPELNADGTLKAPGFAIYYDPESYTLICEDGVTYLRTPIGEDYPPCQMEILYLSDRSPIEAADALAAQLSESWEIVYWDGSPEVGFSYSGGLAWNDPCADVTFVSDTLGGCFQITARYFVEATEGHGTRFAHMVQDFTVIAP